MDRADRQNSTSQISNLIKSKLNLTDLIKSKDLLRGRVAKEYSAGVLLQGYIDFFFFIVFVCGESHGGGGGRGGGGKVPPTICTSSGAFEWRLSPQQEASAGLRTDS